MNIFEYFKQKNINTVDTSFYRKIDEWNSWYRGNVRGFTFYKVYTGHGNYTRCKRHSIGAAKKVSEDMAALLLNEKVRIKLDDDRTYDFVKKVLDGSNFWVLGNEYQERKSATGTVAYVPYISDAAVSEAGDIFSGNVKINYLGAENIFPISWDNRQVTECAFAFYKTYMRKKYAQIQMHQLEGQQYVITNTVVECTAGAGKEIPPEKWNEIPVFANLAPRIETGSDKPQFVIDRLNLVNNADTDDTNPMGISLYANSIDVLRKLDLEYDSYANEFNLGRKRIFVKPQMMSDRNGNMTFDTNDTVFYQLPEDYSDSDDGLIKEVNMELRVEAHSNAINDDLNLLSSKCGFGTQRYKFDQGSLQTATQVISENTDMFRTLQKHELILEPVLKDLIRIIIRLGIAVKVPNLVPDPVITIDFDDSIIEDKTAERATDRQDVAMGVMSLAEYRAKWYGETEEQAKARLPEQTSSVMP